MAKKTGLTNAESLVLTCQLLYPSIYGNRMSCLESMMTSGNFYWKDGELLYAHPDKKYNEMMKLVRKGKAPSISDRLWEYELEVARKSIAESHSRKNDSVEDLAKSYLRLNQEREEVPRSFMLSSFSQYDVVWTIPDNVKAEFLALCVEYLEAALVAKIDFTEKTILSKSDLRLHFGESGNGLNEKELESRKALSKEISKILYESEGKAWPPEQKEAEKDRKEWEDRYSPAARARAANSRNLTARQSAETILQDLRKRKLIK